MGLIWTIIAVIEDFKKREVENWWNFSLIIFAMAFRIFWSINSKTYEPLITGIIGLAGGFLLATILYYSRIFAGGDAKLMMALGTTLPLTLNLNNNLFWASLFFIAVIIFGGIYGAIYSLILGIFNIKKIRNSIKNIYLQRKIIVRIGLLAGIISALLFYLMSLNYLIVISILLITLPFFLIYVEAIEESCMHKKVNVNELTIGDWLVRPIKINNKTIKSDWEGLDEKSLNYIKKNFKGKVLVKYGLPFTPVFLFAMILILITLFF
jgi:hypothetical protein